METNIHLGSLISRHDDEATRTSTSEGLEEGEVEGETLLIVESEDQASVDLSHDQSGIPSTVTKGTCRGWRSSCPTSATSAKSGSQPVS